VTMTEIVEDPIGVVRRMYGYFGYPLDEWVEVKMISFMAEHPRDKHGPHLYSASDFGIDPDRDRALFRDYIDHFGLAKISNHESHP
jgi:hypothetical protein